MLPIYRFYNPSSSAHFYTASPAERDMVSVTWPTLWHYEGVAYQVNLDNPANVDPLHRFFNYRHGTHFYTASEAERASVTSTLSNTYTYEGVAYQVSATGGANTAPVYRFLNLRTGSHFYTISGIERDSVMQNQASVYAYEGIAFHVGY
ncbi:hypothetical protein EG835_10250 [bacterium]|nr:hypothetical protein [bacterium]